MTSKTIAIIGGGVSGTLVATHLLGQASANLSITVVEPRQTLGEGLAYSTPNPHHLLNVPAGKLSVFPDDPNHFLSWVQRRLGTDVSAGAFLPRALFGAYVRAVFTERLEKAQKENGNIFAHRCTTATHLRFSGEAAHISLADGTALTADFVILALGNPPSRPFVLGDSGPLDRFQEYFPSPWAPNALTPPKDQTSILLIGSGLTAVDAALGLRENGFRGTIYALSRHGRLPYSHVTGGVSPVQIFDQEPPTTIRGVFAAIRAGAEKIEQDGGDWRAVIDGLRPRTNALWRQLSLAERKRFYRHVRSVWDVRRHRMAPQVAEKIEAFRNEGALQVIAGRLKSVRPQERTLQISIGQRGGRTRSVDVSRIINCSGSTTDYRAWRSPLLEDLFRQGLIDTDPLQQGLLCTEQGELVSRPPHPSGWLFTVGASRCGTLLETTAIPEIRMQAMELAHHVFRLCHTPHRRSEDPCNSLISA